jgi:hypothetical protein
MSSFSTEVVDDVEENGFKNPSSPIGGILDVHGFQCKFIYSFDFPPSVGEDDDGAILNRGGAVDIRGGGGAFITGGP